MLKSIHHSVCVCVCFWFCVCFSFFFWNSHLTAISSGFEKKIWFKTIAFLVFVSACEQKAMSLRGKKEKKEKINLFKVAFGNRTNIFHSCTFVSFVGAFPGFVCQNRQIVQQSWAEYAVFIRLPSDVGGGRVGKWVKRFERNSPWAKEDERNRR